MLIYLLKEGFEPSKHKYESYGLPLAYFSILYNNSMIWRGNTIINYYK